MIPVSSVSAGAAQRLTAAERTLGVSGPQRPREEPRPQKPVTDEYIPEEKQEPSGRYWPGKDEEGRPKICFDDPERAADSPKLAADGPKPPEGAPEAEEPEGDKGPKGPEKKEPKEEKWMGSTDKVDREIERLKKKKQELERRLNAETDEARIKELERELSQVSQELSQKDNDNYRKHHSTFTRLS